MQEYRRRKRKIKRSEDKRGKHTKRGRKNQPISEICYPVCENCKTILDINFYTSDMDAIVCRNCGVCDPNPVFDTDIFCKEIVNKGSPLYQHRNYFAERILQARNMEPRFTSKELDILDSIYNIFLSNYPGEWDEHRISKARFGRICRLINKKYPNTVFTRRQERWLQYRIYCTGEIGITLPLDIANILKDFFIPYSFFFVKYQEKIEKKRSNITSLDMIILLIMYNICPDWVSYYGWYFLTKNIVNKTNSVIEDISKIEKIFSLLNENLNNYCIPRMPKSCYEYFVVMKKKLKVCELDTLINLCCLHDMGQLQYSHYIKKSKFYLSYEIKETIE